MIACVNSKRARWYADREGSVLFPQPQGTNGPCEMWNSLGTLSPLRWVMQRNYIVVRADNARIDYSCNTAEHSVQFCATSRNSHET